MRYPTKIFPPTKFERYPAMASIQPVSVKLPTRIKIPTRKKVVSQSNVLIPSTMDPLFTNFSQKMEITPKIMQRIPAMYEKPVSKKEEAARRKRRATKRIVGVQDLTFSTATSSIFSF